MLNNRGCPSIIQYPRQSHKYTYYCLNTSSIDCFGAIVQAPPCSCHMNTVGGECRHRVVLRDQGGSGGGEPGVKVQASRANNIVQFARNTLFVGDCCTKYTCFSCFKLFEMKKNTYI